LAKPKPSCSTRHKLIQREAMAKAVDGVIIVAKGARANLATWWA
jgi:hypothetical protein